MFQETVPAGRVEKMYGLTKSKETKIVGMSKARKKREPILLEAPAIRWLRALITSH